MQELGIERTNVFVTADGVDDSAGREADGADIESGDTGVAANGDPALSGSINVSVDLADETDVARVRLIFEKHGGEDVASE